MNIVTFATNTDFDIRAITLMGCNAKPNSDNPIGYFGTGLKYAIAVILREGLGFEIKTSEQVWKITKSQVDFRGKNLEILIAQCDNKKIELPFTTELGKNWKIEHAFRELYSNTVDENGSCELGEQSADTVIKITGDAFVSAFKKRFETFPDFQSMQLIGENNEIAVYQGETKFIYYRGIKIYTAEKEFGYTYNIKTKIDITEDRTAAYSFQIFEKVHKFLIQSFNLECLTNIFNKSYCELSRLNSDFVTINSPSVEFIVVAKEFHKATIFLGRKEKKIIVVETEGVDISWQKQLIAWINESDNCKIIDVINKNKNELIKILENSIKE